MPNRCCTVPHFALRKEAADADLPHRSYKSLHPIRRHADERFSTLANLIRMSALQWGSEAPMVSPSREMSPSRLSEISIDMLTLSVIGIISLPWRAL